MSKKRSRTDAKRDPKTVVFWSFMAVALVLGVGMYWASESRTPPASTGLAYVPELPATATPALTFDEIKNRLHNGTPLTIAVVGDSTGNGPDEWVYITAKAMAAAGRLVTVHDWSLDTNTYVTEQTFGPAGAAPVVIWNGSASGKDGGYSVDNWSTMVPETPDLVIINHGHNEADRVTALDHAASLINLAQNYAQPAATAVTLQNPREDDKAGLHDEIAGALTTRYGAAESVTHVFDVAGAYRKSGDVTPLLNNDSFHPNAQGEQTWASVVKADLGI